MGWRGVFWQQAAAGLCIGISFPLGCLPSSEPSSTQPSEPALPLGAPLLLCHVYHTHS